MNIKEERNKSLQDMLRDKQTILEYMKTTAQNMWIDINKYKWTNDYKTRTIDSLFLPIDFPSLIYKLLDMVDLYITVKKYSNEIIIPTDEEKEFFTTMQDYIDASSVNVSQSLLNSKQQ